MSKCLPVLLLASLPALSQSVFEQKTFRFKDDNYGYRILRPSVVTAGKKYPLLLFLHGAAERGSDNQVTLRHLPERMAQEPYPSDFPAFVIVPQCRNGQRWVEADWGARRSSRMRPQPSPMMTMATALLDDSLQKLPVDLNRVYLAGISMGGFGAWEMAARRPQTFAAVVPICGGGDETTAALLKLVPLWAWHGAEDAVVLPQRSRRMIEAVRAAGGTPKYTELPGVGHDSFVQAFAPESGVVRWMFEQHLTRGE